MLKLLAVERRPYSIYRIAFTETQDDQTWLKAVAEHLGKTFDGKPHQTALQKLKAYCVKHFPSGDFKDSRLSIEQVAILADEKAFYDSYYRTYCKFTHAALRVVIGSLSDIVSDQDNPTMIRCVLCAIESIASLGARAPNLDRLGQRRDELLRERIKSKSSSP
jgi:hypothetical protein